MNCSIFRPMAVVLAAGLAAFIGTLAQASVIPPNPGMVGGQPGELGMFHGEISINDADEVIVHLNPGMAPAGNTPVLPLKFVPRTHPDYTDESGTGGPDWTVLNGKHINAQLGWMTTDAGSWTVPSGMAVWIKTVQVTGPGTLEVYEGGQGATSPLLPMDAHMLDPILAVGQAWKWFDPDIVAGLTAPPFPASGSGIMVHNWYATTVPGYYEAAYQVYVGDATTGAANQVYAPANVTLSWVPEPGTLGLLMIGSLALARRRGRVSH
jgi:PEP-CTERM motif-containing protein